ncbi:MAG: hypothetical protein RR754_01660 [Oscillospiraceae bacterium]
MPCLQYYVSAVQGYLFFFLSIPSSLAAVVHKLPMLYIATSTVISVHHSGQ